MVNMQPEKAWINKMKELGWTGKQISHLGPVFVSKFLCSSF